jgi:hypothetical protein
MKKLLTFLLTALLAFGVGWAGEVTDVLNRALTGVSGTSYVAWSGKTSNSDAVYAGNSAGGNDAIQLRSSNSNSGVITTASGGKVKSITVEWESNTASGRTLRVFGKNTPYSAATDLYTVGNYGTELGTIVCGTSTSLTIQGDYKYIGFRSGSGAMWLTSVTIVWDTGGSVTVDPPTISPNGGNFATSQEVMLSHNDADAIYYTLNGSTPTTSSTQYSSPFAITASGTTTVRAIAEKNGVTSSEATATFTNIGVGTIAEALAVTQESQFIFTGNAVVTYQNGRYVWIRDNSGSGLIYRAYGDQGTLNNGDILDAGWSATNMTYNNVPQFGNNPTGVTSSSNGGSVAPFDKTSTGVTSADIHEYVSFSHFTTEWSTSVGYRYITIGNQNIYLRDFFNQGYTFTNGKYYDIEGIVYIENNTTVVYLTSLTESATTNPVLTVDPDELTISDSGTGNTFTVEGSNLGTDDVGVTVPQGSAFTTTTDDESWGFENNNGSVSGTATVTYGGRKLYDTETVTAANNIISATVAVTYEPDLYIVGNFGSGWDFSAGGATLMTNNGDHTYTATLQNIPANSYILFARNTGVTYNWEGDANRVFIGTDTNGGDWAFGTNTSGNLDTDPTNDSPVKYHPIVFPEAGTYTITITVNPNNGTGTFSIEKEVVNTGDFVLVTDAYDLVAGNEVIIVNSGTAGAARTMGQRNNNNYYGTDVTVSSTLKVTPTNDTQIFTLEQGTGGWYFKTTDDLYLNNMGSGTNNYLQTKGKDANGTGTSLAVINIGSGNAASIVFQGSGSRKTLQYNPNGIASNPSANDIFSCYNGNQQPVYIYQREASSDEPSITVNPSTIDIVIPAGETSEQGTATVTESNTTGTTSVSVSGEDASNFTASLNNGTLTVTYTGTASSSDPDVAVVTLNNDGTTATVNVTGYKVPMTVTITPGDGHTFSTSTVTGLIESNVADATIEYSFDGTTWYTYNANDGFTTPEVSNIGGTVTVYARASKNGDTATAQATYTRVAPSTKCTADIVFDPTSNNGGVTEWTTLQTHISEGTNYISDASMATVFTSNDYDAFRFGSGSSVGHMTFTLDPTKFSGGAVKLTKVTINAARYSNDTGCELKVSTDVNTTGQTQSITADQTNFADYVFNFDGSEITTLTIANKTAGCRVYVHSISLEYNCAPEVTAPVITPATGTYYENQSVSITAEQGTTIYYTTNGSTPTTDSPVYTDEFTAAYTAGATTTIKAIAVDGQGNVSEVTTVTYTWGTPSVTIHPDSRNTTASSINVTLTSEPASGTIYYTTDGSTPSAQNGTAYNGTFTVNIPNVGDAVTVKAVTVVNGLTSPVATATYTHVAEVLDVHAPFFSPLQNNTYYGDQTLQIGCTTPNADIYYEIVEVPGTTAPNASAVEDPTHASSYYNGTPIEMTVGNSYYVKAIAYIGNYVSTISEGWYIIQPFQGGTNVYQNLKDFNTTCPTGVSATFANPVQVVYHSTYTNNGEYAEFCYLRDNTDYACVYFGKRDTHNHTIFNMGDWIDGSQIAGVTNIWENNFHIQLGTGSHEVTSWPTTTLGWSEILPEEITNAVIVAGTAEGDNSWGHYVHLRNTTLSGVQDYSASDPKHTGLINDGTADAFYYDKFYRWSAGTCSYTTGGNTYTDVIHHLGDYDQAFFTQKQNDGATFDVYGIVDYYSQYTPPFEICPIDFLWIYEPVISLESGTYTSEQTVSITATNPEWAAEGVVIYYKTDDMEDWAIYTGPLTVNSDTHIQAYAEVPAHKTSGANYNDYVRSEIVEATYNFEGVEDPIITPESQVIEVVDGTESVTVTVQTNPASGTGTVTLYTTDGSDPRTSETAIELTSENGTFTVTETTTVNAVSYLTDGDNTLWSNVVTETYEFIEDNGKTYNLLTTNPKLGSIYVIVNKADKVGLSKTQNATNRAAIGVVFTDDATKTVVKGNTSLEEFVLESATAGRYYFRALNTSDYLVVTTNDNPNLMTGSAGTDAEAAVTVNSSVTSGVDESYPATIAFSYDGTSRYLRYYAGGRTFTTYTAATTNQDIFLYSIEVPELLDPTIDPHSQVVQVTTGDESLNVTVTPNSENPAGAVTYYTTDGSDPRTSSTRIEWNSENGEFPVNTTTTVKAVTGIEFADGMVWSNVVSETYTFAGVEPPTITPEGGLFPYNSTVEVTVTPNSENPAGAVTYYTTDGSDPRTSSTATEWTSENGTFNVTENTTVKAATRLIVDDVTLWSVVVDETYEFETPTLTPLSVIEDTGEQGKAYIVADELIGVWAVVRPELGINQLWAKDQAPYESIDKRPAKTDKQKDYMRDLLKYQTRVWGESNWVVLDFNNQDVTMSPEELVGAKIAAQSIVGIYANDKNYTIELTENPTPIEDAQVAVDYPGYQSGYLSNASNQGSKYSLAYNSYCPANFMTENLNRLDENGKVIGAKAGPNAVDGYKNDSLYFMNPKIQEVARLWAVWRGGDEFTVYTTDHQTVNAWDIRGAVKVLTWDYNCLIIDNDHVKQYGVPELEQNEPYEFHAAVVKLPTRLTASASPEQDSPLSTSYGIYPLDMSRGGNLTAVNDIMAGKVIESVRYYNIMGVESAEPFEGVNIVVTRYTDGSISTVKILK